jgi:glycosyltransferase involved in cell wall biosynthesis
MYQNKTVSLIFPAFNEAENITQAVTEFLATKIIDELIVVNNNSSDDTAKLAKKAGARVVHEKRQGYGFALQKGLNAASGTYIVLAEPDGTFKPTDLRRLLQPLATYDAVVGTRTNSAYIQPGANMGLKLRYGNIILARLIQFLHQTPAISDCGCTYRAFRKNTVAAILPHCTVGGSHFLPETILLLVQAGLSFKEIPVHYYPRIGTSKITGSLRRTVGVAFNMLLLTLHYFYNPIIRTEKIHD